MLKTCSCFLHSASCPINPRTARATCTFAASASAPMANSSRQVQRIARLGYVLGLFAKDPAHCDRDRWYSAHVSITFHLVPQIWDIAKKKVKHLFQGHKQEIYSLDYSRDGRIIASGSGDKTVRIWDVETGQQLHTLYTSPGLEHGPSEAGVTSVSISSDNRLVAAGALDTLVRVWDTQTGQQLERLKSHKDSIYSVSFAPDGKSLVSGSLDKTLKMWDLSGTSRALENKDRGEDDKMSHATCATTFLGHKVSSGAESATHLYSEMAPSRDERELNTSIPPAQCVCNRTTSSPYPVRQTANGSPPVPKIAAYSSGTPGRPRPSLFSRVTRIQVRRVAFLFPASPRGFSFGAGPEQKLCAVCREGRGETDRELSCFVSCCDFHTTVIAINLSPAGGLLATGSGDFK